LHRVLIPEKRVAAELERVRQGILVQQPRAEFETLVKEAAAAGDRVKSPPRLVQTRYWARLVGTSLVGGGDWSVVSPTGGPGILPVPSFNLALSRVKVGANDSVLGKLDGKALGLLLEGGKEHSVFFDWTLRGGQEAGGLHFDLQIPPCAMASLDLTLPADASVSVSRTVAVLSGPHDAGDPRQRLWRLRFTGRSAVDLIVRKPDEPDHVVPLLVANLVAEQQLTPARLRADFEFQVEVLHNPVARLAFDFDPVLEPYEVSLRNFALKEWNMVEGPAPQGGQSMGLPAEAKTRRTLVVELREPFQGTLPPLQVRCLARLSTDKPWTSPWLRLRDAAVQGETLKLQVHPDVRLDNWQPGGFRLAGTTTAADGSQVLTLVGSAASSAAAPLGRPTAQVRTQGVDFLARQRTWWQIDPQGSSLTAEITYEVSRGSLIELPVTLPEGWQVDDLSVQPRELLRNWAPVTTAGKLALVVDLQRPLVPREEARLTVRLHSNQGRGVLAGGKSYDFPELAPVGPCVREGTLAISVDPLFETTLVRASVPASAPDTAGPWGSAVPTLGFNARNQPVSGTLRLRPRPPSIQAICRSDFVLAPGSAAMSVRLELEARTGAADTVDVQFSTPVPNGWEWQGVSRTDLIRGVQRVLARDARHYLLALGQHQGLAAAIALAMPARGERWRLTFNQPLGRREVLSFQTILKQFPRRYGQRGRQFTGWQWQLPLVTVPSATSLDAEVNLHMAGTELMDVTALGLRDQGLAASESRVSGTLSAWPSYQFDNGGPFSQQPILSIHNRALPADRVAQETCDRARLVTRLEPGGGLVHSFSFSVWNWRQRLLPVRLPAGASPLAARVDGCWVERLSPTETPEGVTVGLPVTVGEGPHRLEVVYTTPLDWSAWALGASLDVSAPLLPVPPVSFRRLWQLPPGVAPLTEDGFRRLPDALPDFDPGPWWDTPGTVWRSGNAVLADLAALPSHHEWAVRQRQVLEAAEMALRQGSRAGKPLSLELALERLALALGRQSTALVIDLTALRTAGLSRRTALVVPGPAAPGSTWQPFWESLGLVYVPSQGGALLTTTRQWEAWQTAGGRTELLPPALEEAVRQAGTRGQDGSGRFRSALLWAPAESTAEAPGPTAASPAALADKSTDSFGSGWTEWEPVAGSNAPPSLVVVRRDMVRFLGWGLAGLLALLAWQSRRRLSARWRFRLVVVWLATAGLAVLWLSPALRAAAWGPSLTGLVVALLWYVRLGKTRPEDRRPSPAGTDDSKRPMKKIAATGISMLLVLAALSGGLPRAGSQPPSPYTVLLVPGLRSDDEMALVTPDLLGRLRELKERGSPAARGVVPVSAVYEGKLSGGLADFKGEFQVYSFAEHATLTLGLGGIELKEGALLDGAAVYPLALPAPQGGYSLAIAGKGPHTVMLMFTARVLDAGEHIDLDFTVPKLPQNRLVVTLPASAQGPVVLSALGAQQTRGAEGRELPEVAGNGQVRVEADLGRAGAVHVRWLAANRAAQTRKMQVREAYLWDLRQPIPSLTALLNYAPAQGPAGRFLIHLPAGIDVRSVEVRQAGAPPENAVVARLKTWRIAGAGGNRQLQVDLQTPVASPVQLTLGLIPQLAAGPNALFLALPTPLDAQPSEGFLAYQVKNWDVVDKAQYLGVTNLVVATFAKVWGAGKLPEAALPARAYTFRRTPGGVSGLALVLQDPRPQASQEVSWTIQREYAELRAKVDLNSRQKDVMFVQWAVPPELIVADVRGQDVDHWSRAADHIQVWLRAAKKTTSIELGGWVGYPPGTGPRGTVVSLPALPLKSVKFGSATVRIIAAPSVELEPEQLQNLTPAAAPEPGPFVYLAKQPSYRAVFRVRPAPARFEARTLTVAEINAGDLVFHAHVALRMPRGQARAVTIRLRNWDGDKVRLEGPPLGEPGENRKGPTERTWTFTMPAGNERLHSLKLVGKMPLNAARKPWMPSVTVDKVPTERWVAVTGANLLTENSQGLAIVKNVAGDLHEWPAEAETIRREGTAWKILEDDWRLTLVPRAAAMPAVQIVSAQQEAALGDGQRWIHQAVYQLLVSGPADIRLQLPAGARFLGLTLDGQLVVPRQPGPESLWVRLPATPGPRRLCLRWMFQPGGERFDQPNLTGPRFEGLTAPAALWTAYVPPLYEANPAGESPSGARSGVDLELHLADAQSKLSVLLAERKDAAAPASQAQMIQAQKAFFNYLRRAEYQIDLAADASSNLESAPGQSSMRVQQLRKDNARLAREHGFEKLRMEAEKHPEPDAGTGGDKFLALPRQGTPTYWVADARGQAPSLHLTATATRQVQRTMMASEIFLIFLAGIVLLSNWPRVTGWIRKLWPEQLMLVAWLGCEAFGLSPLGVLLFVAGGLCRLAWLANVVQRRWHKAAATGA